MDSMNTRPSTVIKIELSSDGSDNCSSSGDGEHNN